MNEQLLIATGVALIWFEPFSGETRVIHSGRGTYYGIAYSDDAVYLAARGSMSDKANGGEILVFDHSLQYVRSITAPFPLRDMHQIVHARGRLWITCSYDDLIAVYDGERWERWYIAPDAVSARGALHLNSIYFSGNDVYVLAHKNGPSLIYRFDCHDLTTPTETIRLGIAGHNIWFSGEDIYTCSSYDGLIVSRSGFLLETGDYPRGVAVGTDTTYIGVSRFAEREYRDKYACWIRAYDREWGLKAIWRFNNFGQINEIRLLGDTDSAMPDCYVPALPHTPGETLDSLVIEDS